MKWDGDSTRTRILDATFVVLSRRGRDKLSLSEVATEAGISRPTLYRLFASKADLMREFGVHEQRKIQQSFADATEGLDGDERLDAVLRIMVDFQRTNSMARRVDLEPGQVLAEMGRVIPILREWVLPFLGPGRELAAGALVRIAIGHYTIPSDDDDAFLDQLRLAAGLPFGAQAAIS